MQAIIIMITRACEGVCVGGPPGLSLRDSSSSCARISSKVAAKVARNWGRACQFYVFSRVFLPCTLACQKNILCTRPVTRSHLACHNTRHLFRAHASNARTQLDTGCATNAVTGTATSSSSAAIAAMCADSLAAPSCPTTTRAEHTA